MFKKEWIRNWLVIFALLGCSQPPINDIEKLNIPIKVAIIDSGLDLVLSSGVRLCSKGHYDFIKDQAEIGEDITDDNHGTRMSRIISKHSDGDYCLIIYRVLETRNKGADVKHIINAINKAKENGVQVINMSISVKDIKAFDKGEFLSLKKAGDSGIKIFIAAGNNDSNLDTLCDVYPACYTGVNVTVVGSQKVIPTNKSNYGKIVTRIEKNCDEGICGTSVSAAIASGKTIKELNGNR